MRKTLLLSATALSTLLLSATALSLLAGTASAGFYTNGTWSTSPDEGNAEVYGDAIDDYSGSGSSNLNQCINGLEKWIDKMGDAGYTRYRYSTDGDAWSTDLEASGEEDLYGDAADFAYFSGHGNSGYFKLNGTYGDDYIYDSETELGDNDLEFLAFDSCKTVNAAGRTDWITYNRDVGLHFVLGFESNAKDVKTTAKNYGKYLDDGYHVRCAWIAATQDGHGSSYTGAYVRFTNSSCNTLNDTSGSFACDPTSSSSTVEYTWTL